VERVRRRERFVLRDISVGRLCAIE